MIASRAIPGRSGDRGIFVSVAERINAGDRLYVDVWDQKDPLFYYLLAFGRTVSPFLDIVIEISWLALAAFAGWRIARCIGLPRQWAILVGSGLVPLVLTGVEYIPGFTHLPGTVLGLLAVAFMLDRRMLLVGITLGLLLFFKITTLPVAIVMVGILGWRTLTRGSLRRVFLGFVSVVSVVFVVMAIRGELLGYFEMLSLNFAYSDGSWMGTATNPYIKRIELTMTTVATTALLASSGLVAIGMATRLKRINALSEYRHRLLLTAVVGLGVSVALIAATGLRYHHAQVLALPAAVSLLAAAAATPQLRRPQWSSLIAVVSLSIVLTGGLSPQAVVLGGLSAPTRARALMDTAPATQALLATGQPSAYARLGRNTDDSHAMGLARWTLACPRFHQYPYDPVHLFDAVLDCAAEVPFLIVDDSAGPEYAPSPGFETNPGFFANWNAFAARTESMLSARFACDAYEWGRLCRNLSFGQGA